MNRKTVLDIATAPRRKSKRWAQHTITWGEIIDWTETPADHKECGGYVLGRLNSSRRTTESIVSRSAIVLDADRATADFLMIMDISFTNAAVIHSTYSHTAETPRFRVIVPTDRPLAREEYRPAAQQLMRQIGLEYFDTTSDEVARFMFKPSTQGLYEKLVIDGPAISVDQLLADTLIPESVSKTKRDPFTLEGYVGAFNRAYIDLADLVETYNLPYEHEGSNRWHLVGASSVAGLGEVSEGLWYSHHANDPAHGHAQTAFDMVRLHRFADLDKGAAEGTPINRLPSYRAMTELAADDERVKADLVSEFDQKEAEAEEAVGELDEDDDSWPTKLRVIAKGQNAGRTEDCEFNWRLISKRDAVFRSLTQNEMTSGYETTSDLPWRKRDEPSPTFNRNDRTELRSRIERLYGFKPDRSHLDDLVNAHAAKNPYHPIRDYLNGLKWDGRPRLETCLPGVRPTEYTRFVARRVMIAAVARIMEPGCKWDHTLVIYGKEGLGKSYWIHKLARGFAASLGRIGDKDTLLEMQRSWIMIADEGHALRGGNFDAQKEFLTKTDDTFRRPYEPEAQLVKRHSVIWATTNSRNFLERAEGNRRFLIVHAEDKVDFSALTDDYISALWAEAVDAYKSGEQWHLTEEESVIAAENREKYTLDDPRMGITLDYLDTPVPPGWDDKSPEERAWWFKSRGDDMGPGGSEEVQTVCAAQVLVEAMGKRLGDWKTEELRAIHEIMDHAPGWVEVEGLTKVPMYGLQKVWTRNNSS